MPSRYPYQQGSIYPTGIEPLAIDLDKNIFAITQQMVKSRKEQIKEQKLEIDENEKLILDALDFEPVAGMGDEQALKHLQRVDEMTDKYARLWKDRGGKLSTEDKLSLAKDKRDVEAKLKTASADIATIAEIKKELAKGDKSIYDIAKTAKNLLEYEKSGKVGLGGAINVPVIKEIPSYQAYADKISPLLQKEAMNTKAWSSSISEIDPTTGMTKTVMTNESVVDDILSYGDMLPEYQQMLAEDPKGAAAFRSALRERFVVNPSQQKIVASAKETATSPTESLKNAPNSYGWKGRTSEEVTTLEDFNRTAEGLRQMDRSTVGKIIGTEETGVKDISYDTDDKGRKWMTISFNPEVSAAGNETARKDEVIQVPADNASKNELDIFYGKMWKYYPESLKGESLKKAAITPYLAPEKMKGMEFGERMPLAREQAFDKTFDKVKSDPNKDNLNALIKQAKQLDPKADISLRTGTFGKPKGIIYNGKFYDITGKKAEGFGLEDFKSAITEKQKQATEAKKPKKYTIPGFEGQVFEISPEEEEEFLTDNPTAKPA